MIQLNISYPTARKEHKCMYCYGTINVGDKYERQTNIFDGQIYDWVCHLECQKITGLLNMYDYYNDEGVTTECFQESICESVVAYTTFATKNKLCYGWIIKYNSDGFSIKSIDSDDVFSTYELALENALKYALENLV